VPVPSVDPPRPLSDPGLDGRWRVEILDESPSTNADVVQRARGGEPAGLVVVTEHQTAGRGRLDRTWETPRGVALTFSLLVSPAGVPLTRWPWLPLLSGLAVVDAVSEVTDVAPTLKWPNDVMVGERKIAGILVELVEHPSGAAAVVGIGLNVSASRDQLPVETATSLALEGAAAVDRTALLRAALTAFSSRYDAWVGAAGEGVRASYLQACSTIGRHVRADLPGGDTVSGTAVDVDAEGRLHVDDGSRVHVLGAGDVVHVRPSS
jgi:BirA family transcriptional regulator, biotin operon repressor / biotin---[acetyl-CoA-carboxylase] ligase